MNVEKIQIIDGVNLMNIDEEKTILFVMGRVHKMDCLIKQVPTINPENTIILEIYGPLIIQPFSDLMRDIIIAVYQENVKEIFVVTTKDDHKQTEEILNEIDHNKELQENIKTVNYLFENCKPEFPEDNIREWLEGRKILTDGVWNGVDVILHHPLMPPDVKITELLIDTDNEKLLEYNVL